MFVFRISMEVVRACGKACVVKRRFGAAGAAVRHGVGAARAACGPKHPRYAAALLDYGFYLLNVDCIHHSVAVYEVMRYAAVYEHPRYAAVYDAPRRTAFTTSHHSLA